MNRQLRCKSGASPTCSWPLTRPQARHRRLNYLPVRAPGPHRLWRLGGLRIKPTNGTEGEPGLAGEDCGKKAVVPPDGRRALFVLKKTGEKTMNASSLKLGFIGWASWAHPCAAI